MKLYFDASVLVALLAKDALTARAYSLLRSHAAVLLVSDFAAAEFASALARRVRMGELTAEQGRAAFANFDVWTARATRHVGTKTADVRAAEAFLRRLDLTLRTPDALNIAIAQRAGAALATFDERMAAAARALGTQVLS
ncbi:MAG: type II toxin-antitoxin system VapC family toxin [Acetobacteraceae bacterium]|nr:type II toxin-antitoxin system VapC family toxin [Acetobacteraceae bacterium]